jgi:hypothetical protein
MQMPATLSTPERLNYPEAARLIFGTDDGRRVKYQRLVHRRAVPHIQAGARTVVFDRAEILVWIEARAVAEGAK